MNEKNIALVILGLVAVLALVSLVLLFVQNQLAGASQFSLPVKKGTTQARSAQELGTRWILCIEQPDDPRCGYSQQREYLQAQQQYS